MPESIAIASFVLGSILTLVAVVGGGFKVFGAEVSGKIGGFGRFIAFGLGLFFIMAGIGLGLIELLGPTQSTPRQNPYETPILLPTTVLVEYSPPPDTTTILPPAAPPVNYSCPEFQGASWLSLPGTWYGPNEWNGITYSISYDQYYIYTWNSYYNNVTSYSDPAFYGGRNQWLPLSGSPYTICVDTSGNVYAAFTP